MDLRNEGNRLPILIRENGDKIERRMKIKYSTRLSNYGWLSIGFKSIIFLVTLMSLIISTVFAQANPDPSNVTRYNTNLARVRANVTNFNTIRASTLGGLTTPQIRGALRFLYDFCKLVNDQHEIMIEPFRKISIVKRWRDKNRPKYISRHRVYMRLKNLPNPSSAQISQKNELRQWLIKKWNTWVRYRAVYAEFNPQCTDERRRRYKRWQAISQTVVFQINRYRAELGNRL